MGLLISRATYSVLAMNVDMCTVDFAREMQGPSKDFVWIFFFFSKRESEGYKHHGDCNVLQIKGPSMSCLLWAEMSWNHNFSVHWDLFEVVLVSQ